MPQVIPDDTRRFIDAYIDSIAELEALLLLRDHQAQGWTREMIAERLYISNNDVAEVMTKLVARGLVFVQLKDREEYRYQPQNEEMARSLDQLADVYAKHLVPVTKLVHGKARRHLQVFADAFKFTKET